MSHPLQGISDALGYDLMPSTGSARCSDPMADLKREMAAHFNSGMRKDPLTDLVISCKGNQYHVHRNILLWQCDFFRRALNPNHGFKESVTGIIQMDEDPLQIVKVFLEYLYTYNYRDPNFKSDEERDETLIFHAHVYAFAEQYDTPGLQQVAATKLCNALTPARKMDCFTISLDIMREIYTTTPPRARHLRDIVMTAFQNDQARRSLLQSKAFIKIADDAPEVWRDFLQGALGLVETRWGVPWVLRDEERDRMFEVLSDIPPRWRPLVLHPLLADRGSTNGVLALSQTRSYLREKVDKVPNRYKRIVRALFGLQCDPKTYRCEGCDGTFDWALPAKACRTGPWPCRRGCGVTHTIDEWEDRVEGGGDEDEDEDEDESEDEIGSTETHEMHGS